MTKWPLYGANGHTGELIARELQKRGSAPVLAGRNLAVGPSAEGLGAECRILDPRDAAVRLSGIDVVPHCAGPFSVRAASTIDACVRTRPHHLDGTGEAAGGRARIDGRITPTPLGGRPARTDVGNGGEPDPAFSTAGFHSARHGTAVPDIEVPLPPPALLIRGVQGGGRLAGLLPRPRVRGVAHKPIDKTVKGPDAPGRRRTRHPAPRQRTPHHHHPHATEGIPT